MERKNVSGSAVWNSGEPSSFEVEKSNCVLFPGARVGSVAAVVSARKSDRATEGHCRV